MEETEKFSIHLLLIYRCVTENLSLEDIKLYKLYDY